jgi:hypothetical protein
MKASLLSLGFPPKGSGVLSVERFFYIPEVPFPNLLKSHAIARLEREIWLALP